MTFSEIIINFGEFFTLGIILCSVGLMSGMIYGALHFMVSSSKNNNSNLQNKK